ncbi:hypothetical protein IWQ62_003730 [Dispira parvispora]|uniref:N-acetyltransferase domain-containing protein n=1 Tax=Dispira parvispora TaxID=1520584 RepID=A0A9W8AT79_9FUNG|nr:hypothetical protein IWQ62_003730 [Dispira parvispora]
MTNGGDSTPIPGSNGYYFKWVDNVQAAYALEMQGYPASEGASLATLTYRHDVAPHLFLGLYGTGQPMDGPRNHSTTCVLPKDTLVGYISATAGQQERLTHDTMATHQPQGTRVYIHSVCVNPRYQRKGVASCLLQEFPRHLCRLANHFPDQYPRYDSILLIAHEYLFPLYLKNGFRLLGPSSVVHGPEEWYEFIRKVGEY